MSQDIALSIVKNPWSRAVAGGALALVPGRSYPAWLRHTLIWGSTATTAAIVVFPGLGAKALELTSGKETSPSIETSSKARVVLAAVAGASVYGVCWFSWWFDEAAEQALRTMKVPFPRVVLGVLAGALYYGMDDRGRREPAA